MSNSIEESLADYVVANFNQKAITDGRIYIIPHSLKVDSLAGKIDFRISQLPTTKAAGLQVTEPVIGELTIACP